MNPIEIGLLSSDPETGLDGPPEALVAIEQPVDFKSSSFRIRLGLGSQDPDVWIERQTHQWIVAVHPHDGDPIALVYLPDLRPIFTEDPKVVICHSDGDEEIEVRG